LNQYLGSLAYQNGDAYYNTGMTVGFRNRIINGAMQIDQRNASASVTPTSDSTYTLDRWICRLSQSSKFSVQQSSSAPSNFTNSLKVTSLSSYSVGANDYFSLGQRIEGYSISDLGFGTSSAKVLTFSFWVNSNLTGTFSGGVANNGYARCFAFTYTVNAANTWEQKFITIAGDSTGTWLTTNGIGLLVQFSLGSGTNFSDATVNGWSNANPAIQNTNSVVGTNGATLYITGVQLEKGNIATSFDVRPYGTELALCQRYYFVSNSKRSLATVFNSTDMQASTISFPVSMRTNPTGLGITAPNITTTGNWGIYGATNGWGSVAGYTPTFTTTIDGTAVSFSGVGGVSNGASYLIEGGVIFTAEL
jgi:hypothetical protein